MISSCQSDKFTSGQSVCGPNITIFSTWAEAQATRKRLSLISQKAADLYKMTKDEKFFSGLTEAEREVKAGLSHGGARFLGAAVCTPQLTDEDSGFLWDDRGRPSGGGGEAQAGSAGGGAPPQDGGGP